MVSVDRRDTLQQCSVLCLTSYLTTGFHNTVVGEFMCVVFHRPVETKRPVVLTVSVALFVLCLAQSVHLLNFLVIRGVHR